MIVPDRQLSLAIGKEGQNARLAAKLTGWRIDIKSASEAAEEALSLPEPGMMISRLSQAPSAEDLLAKAEAILMAKPSAEVYQADTLPLTEEEAHILAEETAEVAEPAVRESEVEPIIGRRVRA